MLATPCSGHHSLSLKTKQETKQKEKEKSLWGGGKGERDGEWGESHQGKGTKDKLAVPLEPGCPFGTGDLERELDDPSPFDLVYP